MALPFASPEVGIGGDAAVWGPVGPPEMYTDIPYAPFSKTDHVGKAADWTGRQRFGQPKIDVADGDFQVVENKAAYKEKKFGPRRWNHRRGYEKDTGPEKNSNARPQRSRREREFAARRQNQRRWNDGPVKVKESSVEVKSSWELLEQLDLAQMLKLKISTEKMATPEDVQWCGSLKYYDKVWDRVNAKNAKWLDSFEQLTFHSVTTTDDPVIREQTKTSGCNVYATDAILAVIAAAPVRPRPSPWPPCPWSWSCPCPCPWFP